MNNYFLNKFIKDVNNMDDITWVDYIDNNYYNYIMDNIEPYVERKFHKLNSKNILLPGEYLYITNDEYFRENLKLREDFQELQDYEQYLKECLEEDKKEIEAEKNSIRDYHNENIILNNY